MVMMDEFTKNRSILTCRKQLNTSQLAFSWMSVYSPDTRNLPEQAELLPRHTELLLGHTELFLGRTELFPRHTEMLFGHT